MFMWQVRLALLVALGACLFSGSAFAQATRTWVSGVGDDANPCSRTAPCKTFAGAISKTAAGGEINALDSGGFGAVTITKSITIIGEGVEAGVLVSGTNAIIVNAGANDSIVLRGLDIEGLGTGLNGIRFLAGASLFVDGCLIRNFSSAGSRGIDFVPTTAAKLVVVNSRINRNGRGINVFPTGNGSADVTIADSVVSDNSNGIRGDASLTTGTVRMAVVDTTVTGGTGNGIGAFNNSTISVSGATVTGHGGSGILASGAGATVRIANSMIAGNATGLQFLGGGAIRSYGNNQVDGNSVDGAPTSTIPQK